MLPPPTQALPGAAAGVGVLPELQRLLAAWAEYWESATHFWAALLDTFRNGGDWNALKNEFIAIGVHEIISDRLRGVRVAIADIRDAFMQSPLGAGSHDAFVLFSALLVMISCGEERARPAAWEDVRECLSWGTGRQPHLARHLGTPPGAVRSVDSEPPVHNASGYLPGDGPPPAEPQQRSQQNAPPTPAAPLQAFKDFSMEVPAPRRGVQESELASPLPAPATNCSGTGAVAMDESVYIEKEPRADMGSQSNDVLLKLTAFARKLAQLAGDMGELEHSDQELVAAIAGRAGRQAFP